MMKNDEPNRKPPKVEPWKDRPITVEYETKAKNLLRGEMRRRGVTTAQLAEKLTAMGIPETERNLNNKISRGGFTAAFLLQCLEAVGVSDLRIFA
jgi:Domain of unknown function (DUF6471)